MLSLFISGPCVRNVLKSKPTSSMVASKDKNWLMAMAEEFNALVHNDTWQLVHHHDDMNLLNCKWIYHIKSYLDGSTEHPKAGRVLRGLGQLIGLDYNKTFSHVVKPTTIRVVLSIAITYSWVIRQLGIKNVLVHSDLHEEVYMTQA